MADSTIADLDALHNTAKRVRSRYEPDAFLNIAFLQGKQWTAWDGNRIFDVPIDPAREKVVDNRIQPTIRTEIAKMTKTRPVFLGVPRTQADEDVAAARYTEMALEDVWKRANLLRKLRQSLLWARVAGAGYWKVCWDPTVGNKRDVLVYAEGDRQGQAVKDNYGAPLKPEVFGQMPEHLRQGIEPKSVAVGEVGIEVKTFFEIFVDPFAGEDGLESAEWMVDEAIYSRDYVANHFPDQLDRLTFGADPNAGAAEARLPGWGSAEKGGDENTKGVKLREFWSFKEHVIWAPDANVVLLEEKNPYPWLPYVMFRGIPMPGRFYPDSVVTHLRPRQVDLNKRMSQIAENADRIANPPLMVPSSMGEDFNWQGLPGEIVEYQDNGSATSMPSFMQVPQMAPYVENDITRITNSIMEISGQHEVTGASVPAGVTAASAINLLQEADDTRLGPDIADMEETLANAGTRIHWIIQRKYTEKRHLKVAGEDGMWDVEAFQGDMTDGCEGVEVQAGSGMPQSKAAQQAAIQQVLGLMVQNAVPVSERNMRRVLREYQVGGLEAFFADQTRDESQVQDENRRLASGEELEINSYDNDPLHIEGHTEHMKSSRFQRLKPDAKQRFEGHLEAHRDRVAQMAPPAMPPPPGGPPGAPPGLPPSTAPPPGVPSDPGIPPQ